MPKTHEQGLFTFALNPLFFTCDFLMTCMEHFVRNEGRR